MKRKHIELCDRGSKTIQNHINLVINNFFFKRYKKPQEALIILLLDLLSHTFLGFRLTTPKWSRSI